MSNRFWGIAVLAGLLTWQAVPTLAGDDPRAGASPQPAVSAGWWEAPVRLPPTEPTTSAAAPFAGAAVAPNQDENPLNLAAALNRSSGINGREAVGNMVHGRLLDRGRPLVNCHVVIVPMHEERGAYCFDPDRKALDTTTNSDGIYCFENVAPGEYKLTWLPEGQTRWIRRIAMRPDIKVRNGETTSLKDIRVALQTIN